MISDALHDCAESIRTYRADYPHLYGHRQTAAFLDALAGYLAAAADATCLPPPDDDRTHQGECVSCHRVTTIRLDTLTCDPCKVGELAATEAAMAELDRQLDLSPGADDDRDPDAELLAEHAAGLDAAADQMAGWLRRLDRAERDRVMARVADHLAAAT